MNRPLSTSGTALVATHPGSATSGDARVLSVRQRRQLLWALILTVAFIAVAGWSVVTSTHLPVSPPVSVMPMEAPGAMGPVGPPPHRP